jgi:hypothetical protein
MGLWSKIKKAVKKAVKAVKKAVKAVINTVKEVVNRIIGVIDFVLSLIGIRIEKFLRIKVLVLCKAEKTPVASLQEVQSWVDEAVRIYKLRSKVSIRSARLGAEPIVNIISKPAPEYVLKIDKNFWEEYFDEINDYFEENARFANRGPIGSLMDFFGYGPPIFIFVVEDVHVDEGECGYSYSCLMNDFIVIDSGCKLTTLAHEIGHKCGLFHRSGDKNLMNKNRIDPGDELSRWQITVVRNSRYVTFFNDGR